MGVGMVAVVAPEDTDRALAILTAVTWTAGSWAPSPGRSESQGRATRHAGGAAPQVLREPSRRVAGNRLEIDPLESAAPVVLVPRVVAVRILSAGPGQLPLKLAEIGLRRAVFQPRATLVCFALARPRPVGNPARNNGGGLKSGGSDP